MKNVTVKHQLSSLLATIILCLTAFAFTPHRGLDRYEIYLNNKLILKQAVNAPVNLRKLELGKADNNGLLRIFYTHCSNNGMGTSRSIVIKDGKGDVLKKWAFKNADKGMEISVKELLQVERRNRDKAISLHYIAQELPDEDMLLASVRFE